MNFVPKTNSYYKSKKCLFFVSFCLICNQEKWLILKNGHIKKLKVLNRKALIQIGLMLQYMKLFSRSKEQRAQYVNSYSPFHFLPCLLFILLSLLSGGVTGEARTRILDVNNWCFLSLRGNRAKAAPRVPFRSHCHPWAPPG